MPILHWLNDEEARKTSSQLPYRLLEADTKNSFGDSDSENMLIQGDNLEALKALLPYYAGQVKCIFIDPPYNTQSAFEHYDDNLEHSTWLSTMYPRLEMLRELLATSGIIWVSIDDNEGHYLKTLMDELFGRMNFLGTVTWVKTSSVHNNAEFFSSSTDMILVYSKDISQCKFNRIPRSERNIKDYSNPDNDPRGDYSTSPLHVSLTSGQRGAQYARTGQSSGLFPIINPHGKEVYPPKGRCWGYSPQTIKEFQEQSLIWWGKDGTNQPRLKRFLKEQKEGVVSTTCWGYDDVGHNQEAKKEISLLIGKDDELFSTPKPERLISRIITISSGRNDLVLDSFLGSGTTAAVAHKMGRRYIGIEMGDHAVTHCAPRLKKVIEGEQGGISKDVNWQGGGGFSFYRLGETVFDEQGHINSKVKFKSLAAHVWFSETHTPLLKTPKTPLLGVHNETAFFLLYNGILGDKTPAGGNVLTARVLRELPKHKGKKVIYGEMSMLDEAILQKQEITFKHIPYDIKAR